ncbi:putative CCR4-associated factor 1-10-like protein [Panicum miliaceum]|uniref:CCR4-associated factor 1-10-like protein n=1 Tax=Panicum miliaceum TaxID=4540 RepID=A0A3L6T268_PANMI|nr:putative CCR4-associated factor 1-10-like protein [Panicum miliaceum]
MLPRLQVDSDDVKIVEIWRDTSQAAFSEIGSILRSIESGSCFVALDTEFCIPDGINVLPYEPPTPDAHYSQLRSYVHGGDLVHIGIGFADTEFKLIGGRVYQFNIFFDPTKRSPDHCGVKFLRQSGLRLEEHARRGLPALDFMNMLCQFSLLQNKKLTWVTFMGYPDFGFIIHLLTRNELPEDRTQFLLQVTEYFPSSCDCKFFSKYGYCIKMERVPGKLEGVATALGAKRTGKGHQAASDALPGLRCFNG